MKSRYFHAEFLDAANQPQGCPFHDHVVRLIEASNKRLLDQAELFVRMGYSPDELCIVSHDGEVDEVVPRSRERCNVCGIDIQIADELAMGMCTRCSQE